VAFDRDCDVDAFSATLSEIVAGPLDAIRDGSLGCVQRGIRKTASEWRKRAPVRTGRYSRSIRSHVTSRGDEPAAEAGCPTMPGLPHLLEKGHARVGGGRVAPRVHIAPAAEEGFKAANEAFDRLMDEAVRNG
jgi:hypothetical protein